MVEDEESIEAEHVAWRAYVLWRVSSSDVAVSTGALVEFIYNEPDRDVAEAVLRDIFAGEVDPQLRSLAVICVGHVGRIHGAVSDDLVDLLRELLADPKLGGIAEDALGDVQSFVPEHRPGSDGGTP